MDKGGKKFVGAHVSISGGVENAPVNAAAIQAGAFALFTKNQRQWKAPPLTVDSINAFEKALTESGISPEHVLPHDSYLINFGTADPAKREQSLNAFIDETRRVEALRLRYLNFHPGAHLKQIEEKECLKLIAQGMNTTLSETDNAILVIETTAGQGSTVGYTFEQIAKIIAMVTDQSRVGVCIDTCHIFTAGYDIRTRETYESTMQQFEKIIGFSFLRGVHLNDSKKDFTTRVDRHECIGKGFLGTAPFQFLMNDDRFDGIPLVLETPDKDLWAEEIRLLHSFEGMR